LNLFAALESKALTDNKGFIKVQKGQKVQDIHFGSANLQQKSQRTDAQEHEPFALGRTE
jgi:hypothetical protein